MKLRMRFSAAMFALGAALPVGLMVAPLAAQAATAAIPAATGVLSGVVTGPNGPEAGVWVIAETLCRSANSAYPAQR